MVGTSTLDTTEEEENVESLSETPHTTGREKAG